MKRLSLTFDNGPTPGITEQVLDALDEHSVKATFFLVGQQLEQPEGRKLAERAYRAGHRLANHSYSHGEPLGLRKEGGGARAEILRVHDLLGEMVGAEVLYRPNGRGSTGTHLFNTEAVDTLAEIGASVVLWNCVPRDRKAVISSPDIWLEDAKQAVMAHDWTVMVLHDRPSGFPLPGPMAFLSDFLSWAEGRVEYRLDFPDDCVPMRHGRVTPLMPQFVTTG